MVTPDGQGRAYFEDPTTGVLGAYAVGDLIDGNRIEQIRDDAVVLRRGDEVIRIPWAPHRTPRRQPGSARGARAAAGAAEPRQAPAVMPVYRPNPTGGPTIGNGQAYLDRLGIPPQALSRAIEEAAPPEEPDSDNLKD